jgi:hypothetical protein
MIAIATQTYDLEGARVFRNTDRSRDMKNRRGERRVSRTATLDGGCLIADMGYSDGDRTITVEEPEADVAAVDFARYIIEHYNTVAVATEDGAYAAAPESYDVQDGILTISFLVAEKLSD